MTTATKKDIENLDDIRLLVDSFYQKVKADILLSPVFAARISDNEWPIHLERLYAFWAAILFSTPGFQGNPMEKHLSLPIGSDHF